VPPGAEQRRTRPTVTLALPGSVIENTQTLERATAVAGLVARTAAIFCIDEVVVIDDAPNVGCAGRQWLTWHSFAGPHSCTVCWSADPRCGRVLFVRPTRGPAAVAGGHGYGTGAHRGGAGAGRAR